ncbi:glycosyltransferase family 2 protein [Flavobacterium solisilvae]|uniref:Glycosyltransferase family 2 protein n=1 Tax=Flavobacterium solisilvae TaxID=1852019 RepID=A0ABX1QSY6_9FLAO|nr:glycosyltransferase family 2 protein [Flavobacterium solisilvae]NMH25327.1 glycosyltransferase family 2 protein [Flavobacterium solisilvae]
MKPLVSIIIPTYNRAHLIGETLDSVLAQTYTNWECIIVDDGSTDNTDEVVEAYVEKDSRFRYYHRPHFFNKGVGSCRNYGLELSKGDYINWFDSDDVMDENFIFEKMNIITKQPDADIVFCGYGYFDVNGIQNRVSNISFSGNIINDLIDNKINFSPLPFLIKKSCLKQLRFSEGLSRNEDLDFFFNFFIQRKNIKICHTEKKILFYVRKHQLSVSSHTDIDGRQLISSYLVHEKIMNYFREEKNKLGYMKYVKLLLTDLKSILENKKYLFVIKHVYEANYLTSINKVRLFFYTIFFFFLKKSSYRFKLITVKEL